MELYVRSAAVRSGSGAATVDGKTIDRPIMLQADKMWALAENVHNELRSAGRSLA
jgi:citrate lyase beta subunit